MSGDAPAVIAPDALPVLVAAAGALTAVALMVVSRRRAARGDDPLLPPVAAPLGGALTPLVCAAVAWVLGNALVVPLMAHWLGVSGPLAGILGVTALHVIIAVALVPSARRALGCPAGRRGVRSLVVAAGIGLATFAAVFAVTEAIRVVYALSGGFPPQQGTVEFLRTASGADLALVALCAVVGAPFAEEVVFRGVLLPALAAQVPPRAALVVQALLFAGIHVTTAEHLVFVLPLAMVGLATGWVALRTRRLAAAVVVHAVFNGVQIGLMVAGR